MNIRTAKLAWFMCLGIGTLILAFGWEGADAWLAASCVIAALDKGD